jgi:hypothetical protein
MHNDPFRRKTELSRLLERTDISRLIRSSNIVADISRMSEQLRRTITLPAEMSEQLRKTITLPALEINKKLYESLVQPNEQLNRALERIVRPQLLGFESLARQMLPHMEQFKKFGEMARKAVEAALPLNWRELDPTEQEAAEALTMEKGICVVWAPSAAIVRELINASDDAELERILLKNQDEILEDLDTRLAETSHPNIEDILPLACQAIESFRADRPEAAQALATTLLTHIVHDRFNITRFAHAREEWQKEDPKDATLRLYRFKLILWSFARALHHTDHAAPGFNRHAAAGHYSNLAEQFTRVNSLQSLMLVTAVVRELHEWYTLEDQAEQAEAA